MWEVVRQCQQQVEGKRAGGLHPDDVTSEPSTSSSSVPVSISIHAATGRVSYRRTSTAAELRHTSATAAHLATSRISGSTFFFFPSPSSAGGNEEWQTGSGGMADSGRTRGAGGGGGEGGAGACAENVRTSTAKLHGVSIVKVYSRVKPMTAMAPQTARFNSRRSEPSVPSARAAARRRRAPPREGRLPPRIF